MRHAPFNKNFDEKLHKFDRCRTSSHVPCHDERSECTVVVSNAAEDLRMNQKECEDVSLIRKQLVQIEHQQSNLLDLLQKFMRRSQNGMSSLETHVHGLELALDEISFDLAMSSGRMSNANSGGAICCKLPGAEFFISKLRRKKEGCYSTSGFSSSHGTSFVTSMHNIAHKNDENEGLRPENMRSILQGGGGFIVNPLAEIHRDRRNSEDSSNRGLKNIHDAV